MCTPCDASSLAAVNAESMAGPRACRRFQCNVCGMLTEVPLEYYCAVDGNGVRHDIDQRPELSQGSVEYIAPQEYMVRCDFCCLGYAPATSSC